MSRSTAVAASGGRRADRLAQTAQRLLRLAADARLALGLLLLAGAWNAVAAALPPDAELLATPPYLLLLGLILCAGMASVAVRLPAAWQEWRRPVALSEGAEVLLATIPVDRAPDANSRAALVAVARGAGYRVVERGQGDRWSLAGTRRGWSRLAGQLSHLALVLMLLGAAGGRAFSTETTFSLLPGEQALLDAPRPGFTDAVRLDRFDKAFGADGRPLKLDATVTFLRGGVSAGTQLVRVNRPGDFGGYLVHGWTYGPAVRIRVATLGGRPLVDAPLPLDGLIEGRPSAFVELPTEGLTLGLTLVDAEANELWVTASTGSGVVDSVRLRPGDQERIGSVAVQLIGFDAYLTFLSRRDPGMGILFGGAALLVACLAIALWLPRRRITLRYVDGAIRLLVRGERFDRADGELATLAARLANAVGSVPA
ncbi:MAG TPA: cytochrome c biogenesis protein ResB [Methylomirabilota bacterium]|jgi:cytochrome c biogenesis protein ResB|nr:cytochrome c biogenesis protein ResB [Methylomirabilota bacterium]